MVKAALASLSRADRSRLQFAFEQGMSDFIALPGNRYIGVNVKYIPFLVPEEEAGAWSVGSINK